mmetsp:Transcript_37590/g.84055  ORF Transcript_37590/g.84055 Transcript_37590/m.84055 type:complete len:85 (-) Transcript_37590:8-262(-)
MESLGSSTRHVQPPSKGIPKSVCYARVKMVVEQVCGPDAKRETSGMLAKHQVLSSRRGSKSFAHHCHPENLEPTSLDVTGFPSL